MKNILSLLSVLIVAFGYSQTTVTLTLNSPGSSSWQVPCGITSITVQCWGGGGAGGGAYAPKNGCGGGGAGGFGQSAYAVTAGSSISYTVGSGGIAGTANTAAGSVGGSGGTTTFSTIIANGGTGANGSGAGGSGGNSTGGAGGTAVGTTTATGASGNDGASGAAATGGSGGNAGGSGGGTGGAASSDAAGSNGNSPGGGGSGGSNGSGQLGLGGINVGGSGGDGQINIIYVLPANVNAGGDVTMASCTTTTLNLAASTVTTSGYSGSWSCSGCSGISITNTTSATSAVAGNTVTGGFLPGSTTTFIWTVTNGTCSYQDEMTVSVPTCAQSNSTCASAFNLSIDGALKCGENTNNIGVAADGCVINGSGQTVWYSFTVPAATTSLVLNVLGTAAPYPNYGLFSGSCAGLTCAQNVTYSLSAGDPGKHTLLTGLTAGATYYVQVQSSTTANSKFCISINKVAVNSTAPANAQVINNCGITYNGTTNGGYYPSSTGVGFTNLDGSATRCAACPNTGQDVTFVVNNISWFKFCSVNTGTYNVQFDVVSCAFSGASSGSQMAILTGTNTSMTNIWQAANPTQPSTAIQTSPNFSLAAGGCAYLVVDGFAGDACSYSYVLTNIAGGCVLLPIELLSFNALLKDDAVDLTWATASEKNNDYFTVEKSVDGVNFNSIDVVDGSDMSANVMFYSSKDKNPSYGLSYYRLKQTDFNKESTYSKMISVEYNGKDLNFDIVPNPNIDFVSTNVVFSKIPTKPVKIVIYDLNGIVVFEEIKKIDTNKYEIPTQFSKGVYIVKVLNEDAVLTKRMLVK